MLTEVAKVVGIATGAELKVTIADITELLQVQAEHERSE